MGEGAEADWVVGVFEAVVGEAEGFGVDFGDFAEGGAGFVDGGGADGFGLFGGEEITAVGGVVAVAGEADGDAAVPVLFFPGMVAEGVVGDEDVVGDDFRAGGFGVEDRHRDEGAVLGDAVADEGVADDFGVADLVAEAEVVAGGVFEMVVFEAEGAGAESAAGGVDHVGVGAVADAGEGVVFDEEIDDFAGDSEGAVGGFVEVDEAAVFDGEIAGGVSGFGADVEGEVAGGAGEMEVAEGGVLDASKADLEWEVTVEDRAAGIGGFEEEAVFGVADFLEDEGFGPVVAVEEADGDGSFGELGLDGLPEFGGEVMGGVGGGIGGTVAGGFGGDVADFRGRGFGAGEGWDGEKGEEGKDREEGFHGEGVFYQLAKFWRMTAVTQMTRRATNPIIAPTVAMSLVWILPVA